jgi:predicted aminopeptidase
VIDISMRTLWRVISRLVLAALAAAGAFLAFFPTGRYLARAGWEEGKILARRQPITDLVASPLTDADTRARLRLVLDARAFAADSVGLRAGESFTTYSRLERDTLVLVLSGAYRDRLEPYTWWFPIVGRVPYKGFFDFSGAKNAARDLERRGFDTYLRPASAFSTLGWFNDPLLTTTLRADSLDLANTVIHELTHNTFYAPGNAVFNESFANFVGARGAAWFFRSRGNPGAAAAEDSSWYDQKVLGAFWTQLHHTLDSAYKAHPRDRAARLAARDRVYTRARRDLVAVVGPQLRTIVAGRLAYVRLDNAALLARRIYLTDLDVFDVIWEREAHDLRRTIIRITGLAKGADDPFKALHVWTGDATAASSQR